MKSRTSTRTFKIKVVGCRVNQVEANLFQKQCEATGWTCAKAGTPAEVYWIHTCTVTARADRDSRKLLVAARKENPQAAIVVSGCLAELEPEFFQQQPNVKVVISQSQRSCAVALVEQALNSAQTWFNPADQNDFGYFGDPQQVPSNDRARIQIKIEDGCDGVCSYCRVQLARGKPISRPKPDILQQIQICQEKGFQEIVLTGVNLGCWQPGLPQLLADISKLPGSFRVRLSSLEPQYLSEDFIQAMAQAGNRVCPHLHLAIQSGDDNILKVMQRNYNTHWLQERIQWLRQVRPEMVFSGDIIVGFPGETEEAFQNSCDWVQQLGLTRLHVFPFSPRPGTLATKLPGGLTNTIISQRAKLLRKISLKLTEQHCQMMLNQTVQVLLERETAFHRWVGTTETFDRARIHGSGKKKMLVTGRVIGHENGVLLVK